MPPKREVISVQRSEPLALTCEWQDCQEVFDVMTDFLFHVTDHLEGTVTSVKNDDESCAGFACQWRECGLDALNDFVELVRHVYFHAFHVRIKSVGMSLILKNKLRGCQIDSVSRNMIPELPDKLHCSWVGCDALFDNAYQFYSHVKSHCDWYSDGNNVPGGCRCLWEGCSMVAKSKHKLKDHLKSHTQEKIVACPTCGSLFSNTTKFFDHIKRQTDTEVQNYQCSHCSKKFATERLLRDHMRHHVNHYKCPICDMTCPTPSGLRAHIRYRHTTEKPFKCNDCPFTGKTSAVLRRHAETHSKMWFKCDMDSCTFKCHNLSDMNGHYRQWHEGPSGRKYSCHLCDDRYDRGHRLTLHLKNKHKFKWPSGHNRFRYKRHEDGFYRLQTVRYESIELAEQMLTSDKVDDADSTGNVSETVAPSSEMMAPPGVGQDNDFSYNLEMLGDVALHFPKGHQSLKGSEMDMEVEDGHTERTDDGNDGHVYGVRDSVENGSEFGADNENGAGSSRQVEKYALFSGMKVIVPSGTTDVIDDMLVCADGTDVSMNDVITARSSLDAGHCNSSRTDGSDSMDSYTVLDLSQSLR